MKSKKMKKSSMMFFVVCFCMFFHSAALHAQEKIIETKYFENNPGLGGDVTINKSTKEAAGFTTFEIEAKASGSYVLSLWASPVQYPDGNYSLFDVYVNGIKTSEQVKFTKGGWQAITLSERVNIEGLNTIAFSTGKEEIPAIEFIRLSTEANKAKISSAKYDDYLATVAAKADSSNYTGRRQISVEDSLYSEPSQLQDPAMNYLYFGSTSFAYTYYRTHSFSANQVVSVSAVTPNNDELIIEVFSASTPETYSWATSVQTHPSISITIPVSGIYYVRVRPYWNGTTTTATVTTNGTVEADVPVFAVGLRAIQNTSAVYNTFTVLLSGDPQIWITEYASPEKITHYNDDYGSHGGDFSWGLNSRIKKQFPRQVDAILLSSYGTYNPTGVAEVYAKCQNSNIMSSFPRFKGG
jgi:hypothetical protein